MQQKDFTITSLLLVALGYTINASTFSKYIVLNGTKIEGNWSTVPNVNKGYMCCIACEQDTQCTAANHNEDSKTCEMTHGSDGLKLTTSYGWKAYFSYETTCTFDHEICRWTWDTDWRMNSGLTKSTGPIVDHTLRTASGMYLYTEFDGRRMTSIRSHGMTGDLSICLSFYYQSQSSEERLQFDIMTMDLYDTYTPGNVGTWMLVSRNITIKDADHFRIRVRSSSDGGSFAIDDLLIKRGTCA